MSRRQGDSKIALLLLLLHASAAGIAVDRPSKPFGRGAGEHLGDDLLDRRRLAFDRARQRIAAEGPKPHLAAHDCLAWPELHAVVVDYQDEPIALDRGAFGREIERHHLNPLAQDVLPHVELGPVGQREHPHALAAALADVVERPQLGPLALWVPAVIAVAEAEHALLGPALLLVAPGAAERRVEAVLV